jgi:hypothetical protein
LTLVEQVFDQGGVDAALAPLAERVAPVALAVERRLPGPGALAPVLPDGGLQRGWSVAVAGPGAWSLAAALTAPIQADDGWVAVVGAAAFGLVAATGYGFRLDRVLLVDQPPPGRWAVVVAALVDAVDVVVVHPPAGIAGRDARRLRARARERGAILVHLDGGRTWPEAADVALEVTDARWEGVEAGHGHLRARRVALAGSGRRLPGRSRRTEVWLPGAGGGLVPVERPAHRSQGRPDLVVAAAAPPTPSAGGATGTVVAHGLGRAG